MKVRCERDGTVWEAKIRQIGGHEFIDCPTCYRGYYFELSEDGKDTWMSDRPLTILEGK